MLKYDAYAKVNLSLELLDVERNDGYHEISTIMQSISLCDHIIIDESSDIEIECSEESWSAEKSLVSKALLLMQQEIATEKGAYIHIAKRIPLSSGLGGDSADAATVMVGLNELWKGHLGSEELTYLASKLGSDVPFFINGGTQHSKGRGEILSPLPTQQSLKMLLLCPDVEIPANKTKQLYSAIQHNHLTSGDIVDKMDWAIRTSSTISHFDLFNTFDNVADAAFKGITDIIKDFETISNCRVILSGAGPSVFTICSSDDERYRIYNELKQRGYKCFMIDPVEKRDLLTYTEEVSDSLFD